MTVAIDLTEERALAALRTVLLAILPPGIEVIRSEINRVAEPVGVDFCMMTPMARSRLSTNVTAWTDGFLATPALPGARRDMQPTQMTVQLDMHGPNSADNTQIVTTLFRCAVAADAFEATGLAVQTLYADEAHQTPFTNEASQAEFRWTIAVELQINPIVTSPQDFADVVIIGPVNVEAAFPVNSGLINVDTVFPPT